MLKIVQVRSLSWRDPTLLQYHEINCSCVACCQRSSSLVCDCTTHVDDFKMVKLQPSKSGMPCMIVMKKLKQEREEKTWQKMCKLGRTWLAFQMT
jgi:hypothetical protein